MKKLDLTHDEAAFLLVLLCEEPTIKDRMAKLDYPMPEQKDMEKLIERVRLLCWSFHQDQQERTQRQKDKDHYYAGQAAAMYGNKENPKTE